MERVQAGIMERIALGRIRMKDRNENCDGTISLGAGGARLHRGDGMLFTNLKNPSHPYGEGEKFFVGIRANRMF